FGHQHRPSITRRAPRECVAAVLLVPGREGGRRAGPVVDVLSTVVVVGGATPATPIVSTTLLFGSTWAPWSGLCPTTLPMFALSTSFNVDTVKPFEMRSALASDSDLPISLGSVTFCAPLDT